MRNAGLIHKVAYASGCDAADLNDVMQEIAMQLWRCRDRSGNRFKETTWIDHIAINERLLRETLLRRRYSTKLANPKS